MMIMSHPCLGGLLLFDDCEQGYIIANDLGLEWDLNELGCLKSRMTLAHDLTRGMNMDKHKQDRAKQRDGGPDPTLTDLRAALLDQKIAGTFHSPYAYCPVCTGDIFGISIVVANEAGYSPVSGFIFTSFDAAASFCDGMNKHIGLLGPDIIDILSSSIGGRSYRPRNSKS